MSEKFHVLVYLLGQWKLGTVNYAPLTTLYHVHQQTWEYNHFTSIQYSNPHSATFVFVGIHVCSNSLIPPTKKPGGLGGCSSPKIFNRGSGPLKIGVNSTCTKVDEVWRARSFHSKSKEHGRRVKNIVRGRRVYVLAQKHIHAFFIPAPWEAVTVQGKRFTVWQTCVAIHYAIRLWNSLYDSINQLSHRAGGNGTASTAMAVSIFEGEKWRCLDSNLCVHYRMASLSGSP